jgi:hypothetical protein
MRLVKAVRGSALVTLLMFGLAACGESPLAPVPVSPALSPDASGPLLARGGDACSRCRPDGGPTDDQRGRRVYGGWGMMLVWTGG